MLKFLFFSGLWIFFMILGICVVKNKEIKENIIEIYGEEYAEEFAGILFDSNKLVFIWSFVPIANIFMLISYLIYAFADTKGTYIQSIKKVIKETEDKNKNGKD